ncbi:hypothetical protein [Clostridium sp.]|uniref:hypothetical protein n=1 Tax=Clostridium sp. TaxID=1506 RepID=UPI003D6D3AAF
MNCFFETDGLVPLNEDSAGEYVVPLEMVRLGPSASNKQPWRIIKDKNAYHFFLCRTKGYGVSGIAINLTEPLNVSSEFLKLNLF